MLQAEYIEEEHNNSMTRWLESWIGIVGVPDVDIDCDGRHDDVAKSVK